MRTSSLPPQALNLAARKERFEWYMKKHPDAIYLSCTAVFSVVWQAFVKKFNLKCLPPPIMIDHSKHYPQDVDSTIEDLCVVMMFNTAYAHAPKGDFYGRNDIYSLILPTIHELRVFTRPLRSSIIANYGKRFPSDIPVYHMAHLFIHELFHFKDILEQTVALLPEVDANSTKAGDIIVQHSKNFAPENVDNMERNTERRAIEFFEEFIQDMSDDTLGIVYNGPADKFLMRKGYCEYHWAMTVLKMNKLLYQAIYDPDITQEQLDAINSDIRKLQHHIAKHTPHVTRYMVVD